MPGRGRGRGDVGISDDEDEAPIDPLSQQHLILSIPGASSVLFNTEAQSFIARVTGYSPPVQSDLTSFASSPMSLAFLPTYFMNLSNGSHATNSAYVTVTSLASNTGETNLF